MIIEEMIEQMVFMRRKIMWCIYMTMWAFAVVSSGINVPEVQLSSNDRGLLDPFEKHSLEKADKLFDSKQYGAAAAEYDAFILEFPGSRVLAYILLRKARAIHLDNKRYQAVKEYKEVLDYFPNAIDYAGPALYYAGLCHQENGDAEKAVKAWSEMAEDPNYSKNFLAAGALKMLAENFMGQKQYEQAVKYYEQAAIDFRKTNPDMARDVMWKVIEYRMKTDPNEPKLREFCKKTEGFEHNPAPVANDLLKDNKYWDWVMRHVRHYGGQINQLETEKRGKFFDYWAGVMEGKFPEWDDFQISGIEFKYQADQDLKKKFKCLDKQFNDYYKPEDYNRIVKWIGLFGGNDEKINEYYTKLDLAKLDNGAKEQLIFGLLNQKKYGMAQNVFSKLALNSMDDGHRDWLIRQLWWHVRSGFAEDNLARISESFNDPDYGRIMLVRYYHYFRDLDKGAPVAEKLSSSPNFAQEARLKLGDLYFWQNQFEKAIESYRQSDSPPGSLFQIAECYKQLGRLEKAVATYSEIENFFDSDASRAALGKAYLYRDAKIQEKYIAALRRILQKYPKSQESSTAHLELEKMGVKIGGAVDSEE